MDRIAGVEYRGNENPLSTMDHSRLELLYDFKLTSRDVFFKDFFGAR